MCKPIHCIQNGIILLHHERSKNVRNVSKVELIFRHALRKILGSPWDNPNIRFHRGTSRKNIYTIQMSSDMPLKSLKMKTGVIGIMSLLFGLSLFAFYDQYVGANEGRSSRIFISLQYEKYNDFIILLDRTMRGQTDNVNNIQ